MRSVRGPGYAGAPPPPSERAHEPLDSRGHLIGHIEQSVAHAGIDVKLGARQVLHRLLQQVDVCELIAIAR